MFMQYLIIGGDNYNTLGMIRTLGEADIKVRAIIIKGTFVCASKSKYLSKLVMVNSIEAGYRRLLQFARSREGGNKTVLLVEGDALTTFLDSKYEELKNYYVYSHAKGNIAKYMDKHAQVKLAEKCGFKVMKTYTVDVGEIPDDIQYPVITKATSSLIEDWKSEVYVCNNEAELRDAYGKIKSRQIILQQFVKKKNEYELDGYSIKDGTQQCVTIASTFNYNLPGEYAYSLTTKNFVDENNFFPRITKLLTEIGYEGIYELEFLVGEDGNYYFLEINLRNSGWSYASTVAGMPLPLLWAKSTINGYIDPDDIKTVKNGFRVIDDFNDFKARVMGQKMSLFKWMKEYFSADCRTTLGRYDSRPMFFYLVTRGMGKVKRKLGRGKN